MNRFDLMEKKGVLRQAVIYFKQIFLLAYIVFHCCQFFSHIPVWFGGLWKN